MILINMGIACGAGYIGAKIFLKRRAKHQTQWLIKTENLLPRPASPRATCPYIVRCWHERVAQTDHSVVRYALDIPATRQRHGYTSAEALLERLGMELTQVQQALPDSASTPLLDAPSASVS